MGGRCDMEDPESSSFDKKIEKLENENFEKAKN